jgi:hypothetical protein
LHEEVLAMGGGHLVEAGQFPQLTMSRDIESRRMLAFGSSKALGDIFGRLVETIEHERLLACFGGCQIVRHGLSSARWWYMLNNALSDGALL